MAVRHPILIVGAGLAGVTAADELRRRGYDGPLVLIGDEAEAPYDRPPLSKGFLRGEASRSEVVLHDEPFYVARDIDLQTATRVSELDLGASQAVVDNGTRIRFDKLLLATGAEGARPLFPGAELAGVHVIRMLGDAERLRSEVLGAEHVLVIGGGWLGAEIAASARQLGRRVTLAIRDEAPLAGPLGRELGAVYAALHRERGTAVLPHTEIVSLEGGGRVRAARTAAGDRLDADVVVFAAGARARTRLAEAAGIPVGRGIVVDELLRADIDGVFAAGDVADALNAFYGVRVQSRHWHNAIDQGETAAAALLGERQPYDRIPHFFSDQYASQLAYHGFHSGQPTAFRGGLDTGAAMAFWQDQAGRVVAAVEVDFYAGSHAHTQAQADHAHNGVHGGDESQNQNNHEHEARGHWHGQHAAALQELIRSRTPVSRERLSDPVVPVAELMDRARLTPAGTSPAQGDSR
jgi:3-phenylpropionate/trans-cinnamate dioxygenase ferredoxin reductase subunit